jgi:hypothetical protein
MNDAEEAELVQQALEIAPKPAPAAAAASAAQAAAQSAAPRPQQVSAGSPTMPQQIMG